MSMSRRNNFDFGCYYSLEDLLAASVIKKDKEITDSQNHRQCIFTTDEKKSNNSNKLLYTKVNLSWQGIKDSGAIQLAKILKKCFHITELSLICNNIGERGITALANILKVNTSIVELNLHDNQINDRGAIALAEAFKSNTKLIKVNLARNPIGETGLIALAEALKVNSTIREVELGLDNSNNYDDPWDHPDSLLQRRKIREEIQESLNVNQLFEVNSERFLTFKYVSACILSSSCSVDCINLIAEYLTWKDLSKKKAIPIIVNNPSLLSSFQRFKRRFLL